MSRLSKARALRRASTDHERLLWSHLRARRTFAERFRRQQPIGPYIADFICFEARLIIELDGGQHGKRALEDQARDSYLRSRGFRVMRFWNPEVERELTAVLEAIRLEIESAKLRRP